MTTLLQFLLIIALSLPTIAMGSFPENNLHLEDNINRKDANITEAQFNQIITHVESYYSSIVESHDATLTFERNWKDSTVNAYANQTGSIWTVAMFGGLARRPEVSQDGFTMVVCHELGHHLAGFPLKGSRWAASEGQSDYFATAVCAKRLWSDQHEINAQYRTIVPEYVKFRCDAVNRDISAQDLCYRIGMAGKSLADVLASMNDLDQPSYETIDTAVVETTYTSHPAAQCRLDTYISGVLCNENFPDFEIPGRNHPEGQGSMEAEREASLVSCVETRFFNYGNRPRCWFAPQISIKLDRDELSMVELIGNDNGRWEPGESFGINIPLGNFLFAPLEDAILTVDGPDFISVVPAQYPVIDVSKSFLALDDVIVTVEAEAACGEKFMLQTRAIWGPMIVSTEIPVKLGNLFISDQPQLEIPDKDESGVITYMEFLEEGATSLITVKVDISHTYIGDLKITLISPSDKEYLFYDRLGSSSDDINDSFDVAIDQEDLSGNWGLKVADVNGSDVGTLNAWTLDFNVFVCD